ncbi:ORF3 [Culex Biggie-like virus]|nr:ORF3 [Culex Biggie-like virus]
MSQPRKSMVVPPLPTARKVVSAQAPPGYYNNSPTPRPRTTTVMTVPPPLPPRKPREESFDINSFFEFVVRCVSDTTFLVLFGLSMFLCFDYALSGADSKLVSFATSMSKRFPALLPAVCPIVELLIVAVPFLPSIIVSPKKRRPLVIFLAVAYYLFVPERTVFEYALHGLCAYCFVKTTNKQYKFVIFGAALLIYITQFTLPLTSSVDYNCKNATASAVTDT